MDDNKKDLQYIIVVCCPRNMAQFTFYFIRYDLHHSHSTDN